MKSVPLILPFKVVMQPMKRLLVATFKGDPEFESLEPQTFDDAINGQGMRVLRYRRDGRVDVYWQPGVRVDRENLEIGKGLGDFVETTIKPARLEIGARGVDCQVAFTDAQGRRVELRVSEDVPGKRMFPLLAPVGSDIQNPRMLLLVYMPCFDFVSRAGTVEARIGERTLQPESIPMFLHGRRVWLIRYADHPITAGFLNPPMSEPIRVEIHAPGSLETDGMRLEADAQGRLVHLSAGMPPQQAVLDFSPGLVSLSELPDGGAAIGSWSVSIAGVPITDGMVRAMWTYAPRVPRLFKLQMRFIAWLSQAAPALYVKMILKEFGPEDRMVYERLNLGERMRAAREEGYRQGGIGSWYDSLLPARWPIPLADIRSRVYLWQGEQDITVPPAMARYLAAAIPDCQAEFIAGAGHFWIFDHLDQVLAKLVAA